MKTLRLLLTTTLLCALAACGGGGEGGPATTGNAAGGTISGTATKGPLGSAMVSAHAIVGGQMGAQIGGAITDGNGNFSIAIGNHAGPLMLRVSGGSYTDEATGRTMTMTAADMLSVALPGMAAGAMHSSVQVTPVTAMAQAVAQNMAGGMTEANIAAANHAMGQYFSISDIVHARPMNPLLPGSGAGASSDARNHGMTLAAMSEYARRMDMPASSMMVSAMMADAADGMMDGRQRGSPIAMQHGGMMGGGMMAPSAGAGGLADAMAGFMNSAANASGMHASDMSALIQKLAACDGRI